MFELFRLSLTALFIIGIACTVLNMALEVYKQILIRQIRKGERDV